MKQTDIAAVASRTNQAAPPQQQQQEADQAPSAGRRAYLKDLQRKAAGPLPPPSIEPADPVIKDEHHTKVSTDGASYSRKHSTEGDEDHSMESETAAELSVKERSVSVEHSSGGKLVEDDGTKVTDSKSRKVTAGQDGGQISGASSEKRQKGDDSHSQKTDYAAGYSGEKGLSAHHSHDAEKSDGMTTVKTHRGAGYDDKGVSASAEKSRETVVDKDHKMSERTAASYKGGKASFDHETGSRLKDDELGTVTEEKRGTHVSVDKGGPAAERTQSTTLEVDNHKFTDEKHYGYKNGEVTGGKTHTHEEKDDEGNTHTRSSGTEAGANLHSAHAGYHAEHKTEGGGSSSRSATASVDWDKGTATAGGNLTSKTAGGTAVSGGASATVDRYGNLTGGHAEGSVESKGGASVSMHGDYQVTAGEVTKAGDKFTVTWERDIVGGASAGKKGERAGVKAGAELTHKDSGTRVFKTQAEAETFARNAASMIPTDAPSPDTVAGALSLEIGESRGQEDGNKLSASGSASAGVATVGVGVEKGSSHGAKIERVSESVFLVTLDKSRMSGMSAQVGVGPASAGGFTQSQSSEEATVAFDLSAPDGRAAFEEFNRTGQIPARGGEVISQTEAEQYRHGVKLSLGAAGSAGWDSTVWESHTRAKDGKTDVYGGEYSQGSETKIPLLREHDKESINLVGTDKNDTDHTYAMHAAVDSSSGENSRQHLAEITGMKYDSSEDDKYGVKSSGKWGVEAHITDEQINQFVDNISDEKVRQLSVFEGGDPRNELRQALKQAKTHEDKMRALTRFVGDDGFEGKSLRALRIQIFGEVESGFNSKLLGNFDYDLTLAGDKNFRGPAGRAETEHKIAQFKDLLAQGGPTGAGALLSPIEAEMKELQRQRGEVADPKRYTDLPQELRAAQVGRLDGWLSTLEQLREQVTTTATSLTPGQSVSADSFDESEKKHNKAAAGHEDLDVREVRKLRYEISQADQDIENAKYACKTFQQEGKAMALKDAAQHGPATQRPRARVKAEKSWELGWRTQQVAQTLEAGTKELRASFIRALGKPAEAKGLGQALLGQIKAAAAAWDQAQVALLEWRDFFEQAGNLPPEKQGITVNDEVYDSWQQYNELHAHKQG